MQCNEFLLYSEEWMEGGRLPEAAAHVNECPRCRGLIADLEGIARVAPELEAEMPAPPERVWLAVRAQLEGEGVIRQKAFSAWFADIFAGLPRPALAGAYVAVLLAALLVGSFPITELPPTAPPPERILRTQFEPAEQRQMVKLHDHDPAVVATYRDNLEIVDKFIATCEKTLREDPRNEMAREYLYAAYQQKADLLATMTEHGVGGDE